MKSYKIINKNFEYTLTVMQNMHDLNTYVLSRDGEDLIEAIETGEGFIFKKRLDKFMDYGQLDELYLLLKCIDKQDKLVFDSYTMYDRVAKV